MRALLGGRDGRADGLYTFRAFSSRSTDQNGFRTSRTAMPTNAAGDDLAPMILAVCALVVGRISVDMDSPISGRNAFGGLRGTDAAGRGGHGDNTAIAIGSTIAAVAGIGWPCPTCVSASWKSLTRLMIWSGFTGFLRGKFRYDQRACCRGCWKGSPWRAIGSTGRDRRTGERFGARRWSECCGCSRVDGAVLCPGILGLILIGLMLL